MLAYCSNGPGLEPQAEIFSIINGIPLHTAFHYHLPIVLICLKYCCKGHKITCHLSIQSTMPVMVCTHDCGFIKQAQTRLANFCFGSNCPSVYTELPSKNTEKENRYENKIKTLPTHIYCKHSRPLPYHNPYE